MVLAFLHPEAMTDALMKEIDRQANTVPLAERKQRIEQLESRSSSCNGGQWIGRRPSLSCRRQSCWECR